MLWYNNTVMKLRSTTPASKSSKIRRLLIILGVLMLCAAPVINLTQQVSADQYDDRIRALQQDIARYKAESDQLNAQAGNIQAIINQLSTQKAAIQAQIDLNQTRYDQLVEQIKQNEQKIDDNKSALGDVIANMYVDDKISPIEMLASSNNISDYLDKQEYRDSVRNELVAKINEIKVIQKKLDKQKAEVTTILNDQKQQRDALASKEAEQQALLNNTQGQEASYQRLISSSQSQIAEAKATQALLNSRYSGSGGYTIVASGVAPDYPWNGSNCPMWGFLSTGGADGNGGDGWGYGCRQCASYAAWRMAKETGVYPHWGNAVNFTGNARAAGYTIGEPRARSIAVMDPAKAGQSYGHVAWVEAVNGGQVLISQYNYNYGAGYGMYSQMWLSAGAFDHYIHMP